MPPKPDINRLSVILRVMELCCEQANELNQLQTSNRRIAAELHASPSEVSTSLRRLVKDGFLIRGTTTKQGTPYEVTEKAKTHRPSTWPSSTVVVSRSKHYKKESPQT